MTISKIMENATTSSEMMHEKFSLLRARSMRYERESGQISRSQGPIAY
ncbi:hypothetical protein JW968_01850 [Candidatus Woesearchaeota archaeon]|nr:hypothetical protein [Candidatus Woesearchaeota archaeon]